MQKKESFWEWLQKQIDRDDPIGDLAQDSHRDVNVPRNSSRYGDWKKALRCLNAADLAQEALRAAFDEYKDHGPKNV